VVAVVYRVAQPHTAAFPDVRPGPRNQMVARLVQVPDAQRAPVLWMAVNLTEIDSPEMRYVILTLVAALGRNSTHWTHVHGGTPSLGRGDWSPAVGWTGPNLLGSWSGDQSL
jgi:hypothetical protein